MIGILKKLERWFSGDSAESVIQKANDLRASRAASRALEESQSLSRQAQKEAQTARERVLTDANSKLIPDVKSQADVLLKPLLESFAEVKGNGTGGGRVNPSMSFYSEEHGHGVGSNSRGAYAVYDVDWSINRVRVVLEDAVDGKRSIGVVAGDHHVAIGIDENEPEKALDKMIRTINKLAKKGETRVGAPPPPRYD